MDAGLVGWLEREAGMKEFMTAIRQEVMVVKQEVVSWE